MGSEASAEIFRWEREWRKLNRLCRKWEWNVFSVSRHFLTVGWFNYRPAFWPLDFFWCLHRPRRLKEIEREGIKRIIQQPDIAATAENTVSCTLKHFQRGLGSPSPELLTHKAVIISLADVWCNIKSIRSASALLPTSSSIKDWVRSQSAAPHYSSRCCNKTASIRVPLNSQ